MFGSDRDISDFKPPKSIQVCSVVFLCIMPIAQLAVGAAYKDGCPLQPYIPIYLIVTGVITLLYLISILPCAACSAQLSVIWSSLLSLFIFCWFIAGNVWIYSIYEPNYDNTKGEPYCNKTVYLFAFWTTTLSYILSGLSVFCSCFACCVQAVCIS